MWQGHEKVLCEYSRIICNEWINRGYKDTCLSKIEEIEFNYFQYSSNKHPSWLNNEFCKAHRSNLLRKNKEFYSKYNWNVPDSLPYIWPVR